MKCALVCCRGFMIISRLSPFLEAGALGRPRSSSKPMGLGSQYSIGILGNFLDNGALGKLGSLSKLSGLDKQYSISILVHFLDVGPKAGSIHPLSRWA